MKRVLKPFFLVLVVFVTGEFLFAETIGFEGFTHGMHYNSDIEGVTDKGLNKTDSLAKIDFYMANSGAAVLMLSDHSYSSKPMVSFDFSNGSASSGSVQVYFFIPVGNKKATYINLGTGKNNRDKFFEVKVSGTGEIQYENGESDPSLGFLALDRWHYFDLSWENGMYSVFLDGEQIISNLPVLDVNQIPTMLTLYVGDTKTQPSTAYFDDITSDLF